MTDKMESKGEEHNVTSSQNKTKFYLMVGRVNTVNNTTRSSNR